jgi:MoaA/NifB/PqqE/SkfB family radical SAM enzyme
MLKINGLFSSIETKLRKFFLPGGLVVSAEIYGTGQTLLWIFRTAWAYKRTINYLLKTRGIKAVINFLYVKIFVPVGEGAGAASFFIIGPLIRRFPQLAPYPRYVEIEVTTVCNRRCTICEHTYWKDQEERHLTFKEFKHIVDQFPNLTWTNLTGEGSSFLNKDYLKMIRYLKSKSVPVFLVDHFDYMDEDTAKQLIEMGVEGVYISIDGATRETYEAIRVGCRFERVLQNIRRFLELKKKMNSPIPEICFRYVVTTTNVHEMPQFIELISSLGDKKLFGDGSRVEFCGLLEFEEIKHLKVNELPKEIVREVLDKKKKHNIDVMFAHSEPKKHPPLEHCLAWMEPYIMMGGYVLPCCGVLMSNKRSFLRKHSFGNVFKTPFKDIWNSERYRRFRQLVNKKNGKVPLFCRGCRAYDTTEREAKYGIDMEL